MRPIKSGPLIDQEIEELDAFLLSDDCLENAMDVSGLDGFLCAVLSGPNVIMPSECGFGILQKASSLRSLRARSRRNASLTY
jgi:yecA family protein